MEIRRLQCYFVINCALILPLLSAKPFSINEALAAESELQKSIDTPKETNTRFSLNKALASEPAHKLRKFKSSKAYSSPLTFGKLPKLPSLRTRRLSEITSPLKSKSLKDLFSPLYKRKGSKKREIYKNEKIDDKYFPLFRNLGLLFDNLLNESGESYEISKKKHRREKNGDEDRVVCSCAVKSDSKPGESKSHKKTIVSAKTFTIPSQSITTASPTDPSLGDVSSVRQNKVLPVLLSRDTSSRRGDHNGHSERSSTSLYRSTERDISRNTRNRKHHTRIGEDEFSAARDEEDTDSSARNDASRAESRGRRGRGDSDVSNEGYEEVNPPIFQKSKKTAGNFGRHVHEFPRKNKLKIRRNATESEEFIPKHIRGIRGPLSENKIGDIAESLQSKEDYEEGLHSLALNNTNDQRLADRSGPSSREDQEIRSGDEAIVSIHDLSDLKLALQSNPRIKTPSVSIIDGYSVARDKNGQNKLSEKTIRIHV